MPIEGTHDRNLVQGTIGRVHAAIPRPKPGA